MTAHPHCGYNKWKARGGMDAHVRASKKSRGLAGEHKCAIGARSIDPKAALRLKTR